MVCPLRKYVNNILLDSLQKRVAYMAVTSKYFRKYRINGIGINGMNSDTSKN